MELFKLLGTIAIDNSDANKALKETSAAAKSTGNDISDTASSGEKSSGKLGSAFKKIGSAAVAVGKTVATGLAVGATALGGLTAKALSAAGELEQNMGGSEAVFGEHAGKMQETAKNAFSNMGLSASDFLGTANKMGALFQGAGFDIETSATMSSEAMQRAADVASIMGISTEEAMEAIAGAAKGNFTMMDNLGVAMNDTTLQAYALSKGIDKSTSEMTNQEKIGLAMEMFMEKTAYAAGNYAKENETLAGSLGTAKAALSNFLSGAGTVEDVVSSFSNAANVVVKNIQEIFPKLMTGLTQLVEQLVPLIPPLIEQLLPSLISGATLLINGLVAAMPAVLTALLAAIPALISGVTQIINALIAALPALIQTICAALPTLLPALIDGIVSMIVTLCANFAQIIQPIIDAVPDIIISIVDAIVRNLPALIQGLITLVMGIVEAAPQIIQALVDALPTVIEMIVTAILQNLPALIMGFVQLVKGVVKAQNQIWGSLVQSIPAIFTGIWEAIKKVFAPLGNWFSDKFNAAKNGVQNAWSSVKNFFGNIKDGIVNAFSNVKEKLSAPFTKARDTIKDIADKIKGFFKGEISMPKIKKPKFSISPAGWKIGDLLKGSIPTLDITWHAKAMNNPMIMTKPTIFGYDASTGNLMGGGEAGSEVVSGTKTLMNMITAAVAGQNNALVELLQDLIDILASFFPQILEGMNNPRPAVLGDPDYVAKRLAVPMNNELGKLSTRKDRGR